MSANPARGEAHISVAGQMIRLRPSFAALVAAEAEIGPLFALVDRAAEGQLSLSDIAALFWHCVADKDGLTREQLGEAILAQGLARTTPALRLLLGQILQGA
jgi:Phage tail tube protein, GTA-gp10